MKGSSKNLSSSQRLIAGTCVCCDAIYIPSKLDWFLRMLKIHGDEDVGALVGTQSCLIMIFNELVLRKTDSKVLQAADAVFCV